MRAITGLRRLAGRSAGLRVNLVANYVGQGWTAIANIAFIPAYIHYLGVQAYGLIGVFAIILSTASLLDGGLTPTLNRELATFSAGGHTVQYVRNLLRTINLICAAGFVLVTLAGLAAAPALAAHWIGDRSLPPGTVVQSLFLMILMAALRIVEGVQRSALLGLHRHVLLNLLSMITVTLRAGGVIAPLALVSATPQMFFCWQATISAVSVAAFAVAVRKSIPSSERRPRFDPAIVRTLRHFAGGVLGATALAVVLTQADKILLVKLVPLDQFSAYALATAIASGLYQVVSPVSQSYYPVFTSRMASGQNQLAMSYHQGSQIVSATVGPPAAILSFFSGPVLTLWTGNPPLAAMASPILSLLALGTACHCAMYMPYMLQLSAGWSGLAMRMNIAAVLIVFPALLIVVPRAGMIGAAVIWLVLNAGALVTTIRIMHRRLLIGEMRRWYVQDLLIPFGVAFGVAALCRFLYPDTATPAVRLLALGASCVVTLIAGILTVSFLRERISSLVKRCLA
ncbi:lipopolysaccharide biosynthesis protein [Sphingomonas phyllosphaerae]|uniref:lipopolysaccharide biosynthesis protein n=1 Tax=Sphingomonas phyllosphaerae TaxID=257003 RepID=UPI0003B78B03|nr:oligosaccharide flippase family protein [Sphingomonas phyllosphaerae]